MASLGYIETKINALPAEIRPAVLEIFRAFLTDLRFGHPTGEDRDPLENFGGAFFEATTPGVAGTEFTIPHAFGRVPYLLIPVLPLDVIGAELVRLEVTRAADDKRLYLKSPDVNAPITVVIEG